MKTDTAIESVSLPEWVINGRENGWLHRYELELIKFISREYGNLEDRQILSIFTLSLFLRHGHTCLPLDLTITEWLAQLDLDADLPVFNGKIGSNDLLKHPAFGNENDQKPFLIVNNRLFIRSVYRKELSVAQKLQELSKNKFKEPLISVSCNQQGNTKIDWQQIAMLLAVRNRLLIISGGPGTGKTTTVAKIIQQLMHAENEPFRIALAAPTGKAAARMNASLSEQLLGNSTLHENLLKSNNSAKAAIKAKTLHRLLWKLDGKGILPPPYQEKLPYDLVVVDEASMIDLGMMEKLLRSIGPDTRLILLGDKDQLSSVEEGTVLGDICRKQENLFTQDTVQFLRSSGIGSHLPTGDLSDLQDSILYLEKNYRFGSDSGIYALANSVKQQASKKVFELIDHQRFDDIQFKYFEYQKEELNGLAERIADKINSARNLKGLDLLSFWQQEVWLTVLRRGAAGSEELNQFVERSLLHHKLIQANEQWYHGRPVLITRNNYSLGLFNGDFGVCEKSDNNRFSILFESARGKIKKIPAHRLDEFQPGYFLTVHKSQGSEFDSVHLLLPPQDSPILSKDLVYTAITRARKNFTVWGDLELFLKAVDKKNQRFTNLKQKIEE